MYTKPVNSNMKSKTCIRNKEIATCLAYPTKLANLLVISDNFLLLT